MVDSDVLVNDVFQITMSSWVMANVSPTHRSFYSSSFYNVVDHLYFLLCSFPKLRIFLLSIFSSAYIGLPIHRYLHLVVKTFSFIRRRDFLAWIFHIQSKVYVVQIFLFEYRFKSYRFENLSTVVYTYIHTVQTALKL